MKLSDIKIGRRHRKDLGDVNALAASIAEVGLLHPLVIDRTGNLLAGERRYRAMELLHWKDAPVTVAESVIDVAKALKAERDENVCRKDFAPSEAVELAEQIEAIERPKAAERMKAGRPSEKISEGGETRERVAEAVGMSAPTLTKARAVTAAAKSNPDAYADIADEMDRTGKVAPAYARLAERAAEPEAPPVRLPIKPAPSDAHLIEPRQKSPAAAWSRHLANCWQLFNSIRDLGGMDQVGAKWTRDEQQDYARQLRALGERANESAEQLEAVCRKPKKTA